MNFTNNCPHTIFWKDFNSQKITLFLMGDIRKDYVLDREVIFNPITKKIQVPQNVHIVLETNQ